MKKNMSLFILLMVLAPTAFAAIPPGEQAQFEKANIAYREGKFDEAAALYKVIAEKYPEEAAFSYNLGNALHRQGELGTAILAYERARKAAPREDDINANLNYVRGLLDYRIEDKRSSVIQYGDKFLSFFTANEIQLFALVAGFFLLGSWAFSLFFKPEAEWGRFRKALLIIALVGAALWGTKEVQQKFFSEAIVTAEEAQVYYGPSVNDQAAFRLGEGLKAYVLDTREGWKRILISSGENGWIQSDHIAEI